MLHLPETFLDLEAFTSHDLLANRKLFSDRLEIENAHQAIEEYWNYLQTFFQVEYELNPGENLTKSVYFDTQELDVIRRAHRTLRDRPAGETTDRESYKDQFGVKFRHARLQTLADDIMRLLFPGQNFHNALPRVREEIEVDHKHARNLQAYKFFDLPLAIQSEIVRAKTHLII